jgi:hypothetical protein
MVEYLSPTQAAGVHFLDGSNNIFSLHSPLPNNDMVGSPGLILGIIFVLRDGCEEGGGGGGGEAMERFAW